MLDRPPRGSSSKRIASAVDQLGSDGLDGWFQAWSDFDGKIAIPLALVSVTLALNQMGLIARPINGDRISQEVPHGRSSNKNRT